MLKTNVFCRSSGGELESSAEIVSTLEIEAKNGVEANCSGKFKNYF